MYDTSGAEGEPLLNGLISCSCGQRYPADREACPYCGEAPEVVWYWDASKRTPRRARIIDRRAELVLADGWEVPGPAPSALRDVLSTPRPDRPWFVAAVARDLRLYAPRLLFFSLVLGGCFLVARSGAADSASIGSVRAPDILLWVGTAAKVAIGYDLVMSVLYGLEAEVRRQSSARSGDGQESA